MLPHQPSPPALSAEAADPLSAYRWSRRVLILFGSPASPAMQAQQADLAAHTAGVAERDTTVLVSNDPALRQRLGAPEGEFAAVLVGKDGGVKLRSTTPIRYGELAATVDAMPMRRGEMQGMGR